ncbi:MAG TPA: DNA internalization-related competence protein ComEC/Rec2 [Phycisphaerales bacterium]|nr:DNA internalization-related competence protein ComEC/Rec2 [Phycisphaerales bacterium]
MGLPLQNKSYLVFICAFLCFGCLGAIRLINFNMPAKDDIRLIANGNATFAHIKGQIVSEPRIVENNDWHFAKFFPSSTYTTFLVNVSDVKTQTGWAKSSGKIKFYVNQGSNKFKIGDKFQTFCSLEEFSNAKNPGQFDVRDYMRRNGIYLCGSVKSADAISIYEKQDAKSGLGLKVKISSLAAVWLNEDLEGNNSQLIEALLLGSRSKIDSKLYNDFISTGLVHLVCLSGLNVGIFAWVALWISKKAGLLHTGRSIACIIATIVFLLAVPAQSPVLRAGIMFIIFCGAKLVSRQSLALNSLAISAIILLLIKPTDFLTVSFQLSFGALSGIILFNESIVTFFRPLMRFGFLKGFFGLLAAGLAAYAGVAGIVAFHFYKIQILSAIWTVPASIPATVLIVLGTFKILITTLSPSVGIIIGYILDLAADVLAFMVTIFGKVSFSNISIGKVSIWVIIAFYLTLFLWKFLPFKTFKKQLIYPGIIIIIFLAAIFINRFQKINNLQLEVLAVGHGQCCVMTLGNNASIIVDAGSITQGNIGERIVNPFLDYAAVNKIDAVFISHDDIDHFNGLPEIYDKRNFKNIYTTQQLIESYSGTAAELKRLYSPKAAPEKFSQGNLNIMKLWPVGTDVEISDNESSLVLLAEYKNRKILFCSDITKQAQENLMNLYPNLDIDILITPHHGSARTTDDNFITFFKPEYLITSAGDADFGRTSEAIKKFEKSFYTFRDGAVEVRIDGRGRMKATIQNTELSRQ